MRGNRRTQDKVEPGFRATDLPAGAEPKPGKERGRRVLAEDDQRQNRFLTNASSPNAPGNGISAGMSHLSNFGYQGTPPH